jgi:hypothetical protein
VRRRKQGKGGEQAMMTTLNITRIRIDQILNILIGGIKSSSAIDFNERTIEIWTVNGDKYELILESTNIDNLDLKKDGDWLNPMVYKGKSMSKEEK